MLTEVDIERIMAEKWQLTEAVMDDGEYEPLDDIEFIESQDEDAPVIANGLI